MAKYLISFPSAAMLVPDGEFGAVSRDAHAVIDEAKAAGVCVFGGGIDEDVPPILVSADGSVAMGGYPWARESLKDLQKVLRPDEDAKFSLGFAWEFTSMPSDASSVRLWVDLKLKNSGAYMVLFDGAEIEVGRTGS
jgi:hypothetical protein